MSTQTQDELTPTDELYHIQESTNDDGTVDVEILEWSKHGDVVYVEYRLPTLETETEQMEWPEKASDEYKFVRLVRHCGYTIGSLQSDDVSITGCRVKFDDGETVLPEQQSWIEKVKQAMKSPSDAPYIIQFLVLVIWPFFVGLSLLAYVDMGNELKDKPKGIALANIGWVFWSVGLLSVCYFIFF